MFLGNRLYLVSECLGYNIVFIKNWNRSRIPGILNLFGVVFIKRWNSSDGKFIIYTNLGGKLYNLFYLLTRHDISQFVWLNGNHRCNLLVCTIRLNQEETGASFRCCNEPNCWRCSREGARRI